MNINNDNIIKKIKIVVYGFPRVFSVLLRGFVRTVSTIRAKTILRFKTSTTIKTLTQIKIVLRLIDKFESMAKSFAQLKARVRLSASPFGKAFSLAVNNAKINLKAFPTTQVKTHTSLKAEVARFYTWNDRKDQTFDDIAHLTVQEFVMEIIE